jgi:hypothetical protein
VTENVPARQTPRTSGTMKGPEKLGDLGRNLTTGGGVTRIPVCFSVEKAPEKAGKPDPAGRPRSISSPEPYPTPTRECD